MIPQTTLPRQSRITPGTSARWYVQQVCCCRCERGYFAPGIMSLPPCPACESPLVPVRTVDIGALARPESAVHHG